MKWLGIFLHFFISVQFISSQTNDDEKIQRLQTFHINDSSCWIIENRLLPDIRRITYRRMRI